MNILFYTWDSCNSIRILCALKKLGHNVFTYEHKLSGYEVDADFMHDALFMIHREKIDCCFSINYIPVLSSIANSVGIPYISWVQDSPQYPLYSPTRNFAGNYEYIFDKEEFLRLKAKGSERIYQATLGSDPEFFMSKIKENGSISSEICFLGSLYDQTDFDRFNCENDYLKGYLAGLVNAQVSLYGCNLIESCLSPSKAEKILALCGDDIPEGYDIDPEYAAAFILERKVTGMERFRYLKAIGERYNLTIYTNSPINPLINADWQGTADYEAKMPRIFNGAKINLHFAPRNIHSAASLRVFDVLACKGFLLTTWQPEIVELFDDGTELVTFSETDEMLDKIDYYLKHEDERSKIARAGYDKILKEYTYDKVLQGFFDNL